jgi:hypothetical protein
MRSWLVGVMLVVLHAAQAASIGARPPSERPPHPGTVLHGDTLGPDTTLEKEPERAVAAALAVLVGPFGAHRLYFGTKPKVPVIYGVTLGGFGVLVLIDLGHILFTKDLGPYRHNDKVFMWAKPKAATTPP